MGLFHSGGGLFGGPSLDIGGALGISDWTGNQTLDPGLNVINGEPLDPFSSLVSGEGSLSDTYENHNKGAGDALGDFGKWVGSGHALGDIGEAFQTIFDPSKIYTQFESLFGSRHSNAQDAADNPAEAPPSRPDATVASINTQATALESYRRRYSTLFTSGRGVLTTTPTQNASQTLLGL